MAANAKSFACHYELDQRPNLQLVNLVQRLYCFIGDSLGAEIRVKRDENGMPDAVPYYMLYAASLIYGAADAATTLILHNLGREARVFERQIFEIWARASHYAANPDIAKVALYSTPFQEIQLLDELRYNRNSDRYQTMSALCDEMKHECPAAETFKEPKLHKFLRGALGPEQSQFYALHYRIASQMLHGTMAGAGAVWTERGIEFDSRQENPNYSFQAIGAYLIGFIDLLAQELEGKINAQKFSTLRKEWRVVNEGLAQMV